MRCVSIKLRCVSIKLTFWNTHIKDNTGASQISNHTQVFRGSKDNKKNKAQKVALTDFYSQNYIQDKAKPKTKMMFLLSLKGQIL